MGKILDDDVFQFMKLSLRVAMVLGEDVHVVIHLLFTPEQRFDIGKQGLLLILHVALDLTSIAVIELHDESAQRIVVADAFL